MKPIVIAAFLAICAALLGVLPFEHHDVGQLQPAQTLVVQQPEPGVVLLQSDQDLAAQGPSWQEAVEQLHRQATGILFLKTAERIIFVGPAQALLPLVADDETLRPAAKVYFAQQEVDPEQATEYLKTRDGGVTLGQVRTAAAERTDCSVPRIFASEEGIFAYE